jgi:hypothetical protein
MLEREPGFDAAPYIRWRLHEQGGILLNIRTSEVYKLNESAMRIWRLLMEGRDPQDVISEIVEETGAEPSAVAGDVGTFLISMLTAGVLRSSEAENEPTPSHKAPGLV